MHGKEPAMTSSDTSSDPETPGERFDVVVLGAGSAGENVATALADAGRAVALVEQHRVGGECAYVACIPSKAMLRSAQVRHEATQRVRLGASSTEVDLDDDDDAFAVAAQRRDEISQHRDDSASADDVQERGVTLVRGHGTITAPGLVTVDEPDRPARRLAYRDLVVATGSKPQVPMVDGLDAAPTWTSEQALSSPDRPRSLLILGGGAVGCETAQAFVRFGVRVVLVEPNDQLLGPEEPSVARALADVLRADGVDVRLGVEPEKADGGTVHLSDGSAVEVERILLATGRIPRTDGFGLDVLGLPTDEPLAVDEHCRVVRDGQPVPHVWAAGDVTGDAPYTHTASYRARVIVANLLGEDRVADLRAIPRVVYTEPAVASVGLDAEHAREQGLDPLAATVDLDDLPRNHTEGTSGGVLVLTLDSTRRVLVGAAAIGPMADHWLGEAVLAVRAEVPLEMLLDTVHAFPTFSNAFEQGLQDLAAQLG